MTDLVMTIKTSTGSKIYTVGKRTGNVVIAVVTDVHGDDATEYSFVIIQ